MALSRMRSLAAVAAVAVLSLSACSTGSTSDTGTESTAGSSDQFPVTIEHAFGETTIESAPERVATVSWVNTDTALALGVVPVGMPLYEWGGNENGTTPWIDDALEELGAPIGSDDAPVQYSETDGINFDEIAATTPDVILAAYSGITEEEYEKLTAIAPVVAYPETPYYTSWQDSAAMIGKALGKSDEAAQLVEDTEKAIADKAAEYPDLAGTSFIYGNLDTTAGADQISIYTSGDNRPKFLKELGMVQAPIVDENAPEDAFYLTWSPERANELEADLFVSWVADDAAKEAITADPLLSQIPALKNGGLVADSDNTLTLSISAANVLSIPYALDNFVPLLGEAAAQVK
ncbi:iron-siderophore ABC transporter substrate-binding protein [Arthrobacter caoxuetaonis]|uniref:Iron-siderophore ABC transporter substrate-binding protein n=1 Tax=Arthrobacter caoxuetaonis TaxID=2886935 RepID=A0A9X1MA63_9MICC|nr:iron-siderophore ABC transporter substrate-binding protein [Arthrobacter caoxuetaonis]MCC3281517.1 iron-siderophore ABC transporter substrate-binding protein [Arthrobacter caoxuetaonis]MCC3296229.1 iron-siderophore ABC transporter substrate-binding protein [Arthrobacter caoxuetaonis]USQ56916.1 iron-siderophore ABC transporter substrate-binding protein [Arthrobacter caoxuetaonis]